jgi:hypothetical protein
MLHGKARAVSGIKRGKTAPVAQIPGLFRRSRPCCGDDPAGRGICSLPPRAAGEILVVGAKRLRIARSGRRTRCHSAPRFTNAISRQPRNGTRDQRGPPDRRSRQHRRSHVRSREDEASAGVGSSHGCRPEGGPRQRASAEDECHDRAQAPASGPRCPVKTKRVRRPGAVIPHGQATPRRPRPQASSHCHRSQRAVFAASGPRGDRVRPLSHAFSISYVRFHGPAGAIGRAAERQRLKIAAVRACTPRDGASRNRGRAMRMTDLKSIGARMAALTAVVFILAVVLGAV